MYSLVAYTVADIGGIGYCVLMKSLIMAHVCDELLNRSCQSLCIHFPQQTYQLSHYLWMRAQYVGQNRWFVYCNSNHKVVKEDLRMQPVRQMPATDFGKGGGNTELGMVNIW